MPGGERVVGDVVMIGFLSINVGEPGQEGEVRESWGKYFDYLDILSDSFAYLLPFKLMLSMLMDVIVE